MADALVLDMPVELGLELMAVISPDLPYAEWEGSDHVVNEVDGRELEAPDLLASFPDECQKLDIHLDVMAWILFIVALGVHLADARSPWQPI